MNRAFRERITVLTVRRGLPWCQVLGYLGSTRGPVTVAGVGLRRVLFLCAHRGSVMSPVRANHACRSRMLVAAIAHAVRSEVSTRPTTRGAALVVCKDGPKGRADQHAR